MELEQLKQTELNKQNNKAKERLKTVTRLLVQGLLTQEDSIQGTFIGYKDRAGTYYETEEAVVAWLG